MGSWPRRDYTDSWRGRTHWRPGRSTGAARQRQCQKNSAFRLFMGVFPPTLEKGDPKSSSPAPGRRFPIGKPSPGSIPPSGASPSFRSVIAKFDAHSAIWLCEGNDENPWIIPSVPRWLGVLGQGLYVTHITHEITNIYAQRPFGGNFGAGGGSRPTDRFGAEEPGL